jgi:hypothetical protein
MISFDHTNEDNCFKWDATFLNSEMIANEEPPIISNNIITI